MEYKSLKQYEGKEVTWVGGYSHLTGLENTRKPDKVVFLKDYPETVLVEWWFTEDYFGSIREPRKLKKMIPKSAMYSADVVMRADRLLTGAMIRG